MQTKRIAPEPDRLKFDEELDAVIRQNEHAAYTFQTFKLAVELHRRARARHSPDNPLVIATHSATSHAWNAYETARKAASDSEADLMGIRL